ncbi:MAG: serine acetyltransferase [Pseudomonadota bacterium]
MAGLRALLAQDIDIYLRFASAYHDVPPGFKRRLGALLTPSLLACLLHRCAHGLHERGWRRLGLLVSLANLWLTRVSIHPASRIGGGLYIPHPGSSIVFQGHAGINLCLYSGAAVFAAPGTPLHHASPGAMPRLGDNVSLGSKACIRGPVTIGSEVKLGFNARVETDLPDGAVVFAARVRNRVRPRAGAETPGCDPGLPALPPH